MIVIPYRAKNKPDHFPYVTLGLVGLNTLVYAFTTSYLLVVTPQARDALAFSHTHYTLLRMITAMFLHHDPLHLVGNMLFLWVFGASVEGRLGPRKFLAIYFAAGIAGFVMEDLTLSFTAPDAPCFGASGAIMGLAGAYLYIFPYSTICLFWGLVIPFASAMWPARWLIIYYATAELIQQLIWSGTDGIAHLAHLGGFAVGLAGAVLCRPIRDSHQTSDAQAVRSDVRDLRYMSVDELEALLTPATEDAEMVLEYLNKLTMLPPGCWNGRFQAAIASHGALLFRRADPEALGFLLLRLPMQTAVNIPGRYYLQLGSRLDTAGRADEAVRIYSLIAEIAPEGQDAAAALSRLGWMMERRLDNIPYAHWYYSELIRRFPDNPAAHQAKMTINRLVRSGQPASHGSGSD